MIIVELSCSSSGAVKKCQVNGHARFAKKGNDIVCAAVTVLLRTACALLSSLCEKCEKEERVCFKSEANRRGELSFCVDFENGEISPLVEERLRCIADFIRMGIESLQKEFPENVFLKVHCIEETVLGKNLNNVEA